MVRNVRTTETSSQSLDIFSYSLRFFEDTQGGRAEDCGKIFQNFLYTSVVEVINQKRSPNPYKLSPHVCHSVWKRFVEVRRPGSSPFDTQYCKNEV